MDYEKKYNEALERARALWREAIEKEYVNDYLKDYETIFPELRESEDEMTRNEIIAFIEQAIHRGGGTPIPKEKEDKWIAYLEKQKEKKPNIEICPHSIKSKSYSMQKEHKSAEWSEEDENKLYQVMETLLADKTVALRETPHRKDALMEEAVEGVIDDCGTPARLRLEMPGGSFRIGDKVRVIVLPKEDRL